MSTLQDRVVLVTGGSAGIGRAAVHLLAADGARVVACARDGVRLSEAIVGVDGATAVTADVSSASDRVTLVERVVDEHGRLDAVILNAALGYAALVEETPQDAVEAMIATNLTGVVDLARLALPHLLRAAAERGRADILVTASTVALVQVPPLTIYSATKAGVHGFVKGLRREVTARGVRVHSVTPARCPPSGWSAGEAPPRHRTRTPKAGSPQACGRSGWPSRWRAVSRRTGPGRWRCRAGWAWRGSARCHRSTGSST